MRKYLHSEGAMNLTRSFVLSRLDYCNILYINLPDTLIGKLQRVQNAAARFIFVLPRRCHITAYLVDLHWLKIKERIKYKVACWMFKILRAVPVPVYVSALIDPSWGFGRSHLRLRVPRTSTAYGKRTFAVYGPDVWNSIPLAVKETTCLTTFKKKLKIFLFPLSHF